MGTMNKMLQHAIDEIARLPDEEQTSIAALILDELADERRWQEQFSRSSTRLSAIVAGVRDEIRKGDVEPFDPGSKLE
jgi:hypothetical protein